MLEGAKRVAKGKGVAMNQLINVALAEKLSALRTAEHFCERSARANINRAKRTRRRSGRSKPPAADDEMRGNGLGAAVARLRVLWPVRARKSINVERLRIQVYLTGRGRTR